MMTKTLLKTSLFLAGILLLSGCVEDGVYYNDGYQSSREKTYYTPPRYYPDEVTSGYNRSYQNGYSSSGQTSSNNGGYSSSAHHNGYSSSNSQ